MKKKEIGNDKGSRVNKHRFCNLAMEIRATHFSLTASPWILEFSSLMTHEHPVSYKIQDASAEFDWSGEAYKSKIR